MDNILSCSQETMEGFVLSMREEYQGIYEIAPFENTIYFWKNGRQSELEGKIREYTEFFWNFIENTLYLYDSTQFRVNFDINHLKDFLRSGQKHFRLAVRYRVPGNPQRGSWMELSAFRSPVNVNKVILLSCNVQREMVDGVVSRIAVSDYDCVIGIDVLDRRFTVFSDKLHHDCDDISYDMDYEAELIQFAYGHFCSKDISEIIIKMSIDTLRERLRQQEEYIVYVSMLEDGTIHHKKHRFVYMDNMQTKILMSRTDVTERIEQEKIQQRKMQEAYREAAQASQAKSDFISQMSHDIRTPLNAILGMTMIAGTHLDDREKVTQCLNNIVYSGKHLLKLVDEVLDMSRMTNGKITIETRSFSMREELGVMAEMVQGLILEHHHTLYTDFSQIQHDRLLGDIPHLQQIFLNLMGNAIKYTPDGGRIFFEMYEREFLQEENCCLFEMKIQDNGIGMSREFQKKIFEPFSRAQDTRINKVAGTGLGMTITRNLIKLMGGDIRMESSPGEGTTFFVQLPFLQEKTE